jgi:hypothetical protein
MGGVTHKRGTHGFDSELSIVKSSSHLLGQELVDRKA